MKKNYVLLFIFFVFISKSFSQTLAPGCGTALAFCAGTSSTGLSFPNGTNVPSVGSYSCLGSQPNPAWYYLQISQSGTLTFNIRQTNAAGVGIDVDFIAWGPFTTAPTCGTTNLNATTQVGCSYSTNFTENFTINNAVIGQYYMVLMTNFANQPGSIALTQTGGTGATSCDIVCPLTVAGGGVSDCRDNILTANYINSAQVGTTFAWTFNNTPVTATTGPNFVATPRSNNSTLNTLAFGAGNYCVTARSPGCSSTQSAVCTTITNGTPVPYHAPNDLFACNNSTFNLTQNTNILLQGLPGSASNYRVYYNLDPIRAQTNAAPRIATSLQSVFPGTEGQIIYATVTDNSGVYCYAVAQFVLHFQYCAFATTNSGPICAGSTFNLSASDPGIGAVTYAWTGPNGWSAPGQNISNVPCPTGTPPFNYICTATPAAVGGALLTSTTILDVNAIPVATATPASNSICSGITTDIPLGSNVAGTTFAWTVTQTNTSGSLAGNGSNIAQTLTATGSLVGTVDYTITPTANTCIGSPIHSIITVNPIPVAVATPTPATICTGSTSNIVLTSTPPAATFAWTAVQTDVSGATPGNGTSIAQVLTAPGNLSGTVDYTVTPTLSTCVGLPVHTIINVNPTPIAIATPVSTTICSGNSTDIPLTSLVTGTTFAWTVVQNNVSGASAGNGTNIAQALTATTASPGTAVYSITPSANGCIGATIQITINLTPVPTATISYSGTPFCTSLTSGQPVTLSGTAAYTGGNYSSTAGLTIDASTGVITPSSSTSGSYVVTYATLTSGGCTAIPVTTNIVITAAPTATISYIGTPFCSTLTTDQIVTLLGTAAYTGGTYSSTTGLIINTTTGAINPGTSTAGNYLVTYLIPPSLSCLSVSTTTNIEINNPVVATITYSGSPYCSGVASATVTLTGATGGTFTGTAGLIINATTGAVDLSSPAGLYTVSYTIAASGGCNAIVFTTQITINATTIPVTGFSYITPVCKNGINPVIIPVSGFTTGGNYTSSVGLSINNSTGEINLALSIAGTYTVTYIVPATTCGPIGTNTTTIVITDVPTAAISYAGTPYCTTLTTGQAVTLTGTNAYTGGTYISTAGLTIDASTGAITPSTSTAGSYVVTYTVLASAGCSAVPVTANIVITATPTATISYAGTPFCTTLTSGQAVTLNGTAAYTGGTYSSTAGLTLDSTTGAITPSTSTAGNYVVTYTIFAGAGCSQVTATANVVITKVPTAAISYAGTPYCTTLTTGQAVTLTGTNAYTGGTYISTAGLTIDASTGAITPSTSTAGSYVVTYTVLASAGCSAVPVTANIVITATPTATISYAGTPFCTTLTSGQAVTLNGTAAYTGGTYSSTAGLTLDSTTGAITPSTSTPRTYNVIYTITAAAGCSQVTANTTVIINPIPVAIASPSLVTICSLDVTNITLTSNAIGTTYIWTSVQNDVTGATSGSGATIAQALTVTSTNPGTVVYTITPSGSGCTGLPITATVTVNPLPTATISGNTTICFGTSSAITFGGTPNATVTYTVNGGSNRTVILDNLGAASVPTGNLTATTTYELVSVVSSGTPACSQGQSGSVIVTVVPIPLVNSIVSSPTVCSGQSTGISLSSNVTTSIFNWTATQSGALGASAGIGTIISQNLTATGVTPGFVIYTITANVGACQGPATPVTITVNPIPVVTTSTVLQSVCSGSVTPIALTSNVVGTIFNWNVVQTNVTGATNGSGNVIAQALTTTSNNIGEAVYSITPLVGGCPGVPRIVVVSVNPIPVATANAALTTICSSGITNIALTSTVAGTTFSWTVIQTGIFGASSGSGAMIAQTLTTVGSNQGTVRYTITPTFNGCSGAPITVNLTVNPTPEVFGSSASTICSGESPSITLFPSIAATTFAWTVSQMNVTGAQAGSGVVINDILTAVPNLGTVVYSVTPTANGCSGTPLRITVTVNPAPEPQINDGIICVDQATNVAYQTYILDTQLSNATYNFVWYLDGVVINGAVNNTYEADESGTYSVLVTNTATGCISIMTNAIVTDSYPGLTINTTQTLAFSDNATIEVTVTGGNAIFLYSLDNGPTQTSNIFTNVDPGSHTVSVTDSNGCTNLSKPVNIIGYPTYFTPNGDGFHDTWNIVGLGASAKVFIFDRYGKLVKQISPTGEGWDGTLNGEPLSSTDYWFTVDYTEDYPSVGSNKVFKSHFSLKR